MTYCLQNLSQKRKKLGEIKSSKDADVISGRYMNTLNGLVATIQAGASQKRVDDILEHLKEILE